MERRCCGWYLVRSTDHVYNARAKTWHGEDACCVSRSATCHQGSVSWRSVHAGGSQERSQGEVRSQPTLGGTTTDPEGTTGRVGSRFVRSKLHRTSAAQRRRKLRTACETTARRWRGRKHDPTIQKRRRRRTTRRIDATIEPLMRNQTTWMRTRGEASGSTCT